MTSRGLFVIGAAICLLSAPAARANPIERPAPGVRGAAAGVAPAAYGAASEAPIVSGRSVSSRHKSRMHHVRIKPDEMVAEPVADAPSQND